MFSGNMSSFPKKVRIIEVGPRDGLQNEAKKVETSHKIQFIHDLAEAGLTNIEATSFVHPKAIPQLADAAEVLAALNLKAEVDISVLVPNMKGMERALKAGVKHIAVFTAASETFNHRNIRASIDESFARFAPVVELAKQEQVKVRGYVSTVFGCPYEGETDAQVARAVTQRLFDLGCYEVSLGDTIGVATPATVFKQLEVVLPDLDLAKIALHFHDTRGTALANVLAGLSLGIASYDSSAGGLGGCPYAPGAAGNLATEDLVYLLNGLNIETGIDLETLAAASLKLEAPLGRQLPGRTVATFRGCEKNAS